MLRTVIVDAASASMGGGLSYLRQQLPALVHAGIDRGGLRWRLLVTEANRAAVAEAVEDAEDVELRTLPTGRTRIVVEQVRLATAHDDDAVLYCPGGFAPMLPARLPVVLVLQNPNYFGLGAAQEHNRSIDRRARQWLARRSVAAADAVIAISSSLRDDVLRSVPAAAPKLHVVQTGAPEWPEPSVRPGVVPADLPPFVLSLANDAPHKHLDETVSGWVEACTDREPVPLVLAGRTFDRARRDALMALVPDSLRASLVHLDGVERREEVRWLLEHARVLVSTSSLEAHPLTPAEAGSLGCPLVLTDIPSHREVAGDHASYVGVDDRPALVAALRRAMDEHTGRAPVWTWGTTWADNADAVLEVLARAESAGRRRRPPTRSEASDRDR